MGRFTVNVEALWEFLDLAKTRSFTQTARSCNLSQPTLSRHIGMLEQELGFKLFDRTTNSVHLTEAGKVFYEGAAPALAALKGSAERASQVARSLPREIRVGGYLQIASITNYLYAVETVAHDEGHDVRVAFYTPHTTDYAPESSQKGALDLLGEGSIGLAIVEGPLDFPELERFCHCRVFDEPVVFFAHRESELARKEDPSIGDLRGRRFVGSLNYPEFQDRIREMCRQRGFEPEINVKLADTFNDFMRSDDPDEVFFLSAHGAARVPDPPYSPLVKLRIDDPEAFSPVYLAWTGDAKESVLQFVGAAREFGRREGGTCGV